MFLIRSKTIHEIELPSNHDFPQNNITTPSLHDLVGDVVERNQRHHRDRKPALYSEIASLHITIANIFQRVAPLYRKAQHYGEIISLQENMTGILQRLAVMEAGDEEDNEDKEKYGGEDDSDVDDDKEEYYTDDGEN
ncbi:MAG: hypothetical protein Q9204_007331 [Flavoplaca sp. TL-2023a]